MVTIDPPAGATDLSGVPITFAITSGTGSLSTTSTVTDINGQATTTLTLGLTPGTVTVLASVVNGPSATFTATINGSLVATTLTIFSGDGQTLATGHWPGLSAALGALIVAMFYALVGGRVFCSWVCPVNVVTDTASWLRRRLRIRLALDVERAVDRHRLRLPMRARGL